MIFLLCEGCGCVVLNDLSHSHLIVDKYTNAPTGGLNKEFCPIWILEQAEGKR